MAEEAAAPYVARRAPFAAGELYHTLWDKKNLYDLHIICRDGKLVQGHRCVIDARSESESFKALLSSPELIFADLTLNNETSTVYHMLFSYLYTDSFDALESAAACKALMPLPEHGEESAMMLTARLAELAEITDHSHLTLVAINAFTTIANSATFPSSRRAVQKALIVDLGYFYRYDNALALLPMSKTKAQARDYYLFAINKAEVLQWNSELMEKLNTKFPSLMMDMVKAINAEKAMNKEDEGDFSWDGLRNGQAEPNEDDAQEEEEEEEEEDAEGENGEEEDEEQNDPPPPYVERVQRVEVPAGMGRLAAIELRFVPDQ